MTAKASQVAASIANAEAMQKEAAAHAARFRALYADSAATRAQYDAAETGLARAEAGLRAARAAASELDAVSSYATVRAPFAGMITQRLADPGMFAAPGVPLLIIQDVSSLRVSATVDADALRGLARGQRVTVTIDTVSASATVEGIVPANAGNLFTVNAIVRNANHTLRAGSAVIMHLPRGVQQGILVPIGAIVHEGDLTGVVVRAGDRDERRWVRLGASHGGAVEVTSGLRAGESIVVPAAAGTTPAAATAPGA
jgi:RND family efflux transporter MFP subunit